VASDDDDIISSTASISGLSENVRSFKRYFFLNENKFASPATLGIHCILFIKKKKKINDIHMRIEFEITKDLIRNCNWFHTSGFSLKK
jgi:hypothetical protein